MKNEYSYLLENLGPACLTLNRVEFNAITLSSISESFNIEIMLWMPMYSIS